VRDARPAVTSGEVATGTAVPVAEPAGPPPARAEAGAGELAVVGVVVLLGLGSWAALALAHAGRYSLGAVVAVTGGAAVVTAVLVVRSASRPRLVVSWTELALLLGAGLLAAFFFLPGFPYGVGDKDPGVYVEQGMSIARTGSYAVEDPAVDPARVPAVQPVSPGARLPGIWIDKGAPHRDVPQFYHLFSAALAVAFSAGGLRGLINLDPLLGVVAVMAGVAAVRRSFGLLAGGLVAALLATNMPEVWQAKYQTTEILTQMLLLGAALALIIAIDTGWRPLAGLAGLLLSVSFLARPDMLLLILLAIGVVCLLVVLGRFDGRAGWFAAGLAIPLPHGLLQAYDFAHTYSLTVWLPSLGTLGLLAVVLAVGTVAARLLLRSRADALLGAVLARRTQFLVGAAVVGLAGLLLAVGFLRPRLFEPTYWVDVGQRVPTMDEWNLRRLSWFLTLPGFALLLGGVAVVALRRWRASAWTLILPLLVLFPVYGYRSVNAARLMFWVRRYVPVVIPGALILIAVALAFAWQVRGRLRLPARAASAALTVFLLAVFVSQSLPLRHHREFLNSFQIAERVASASGGRRGVFLWECCPTATSLFAGPVWLEQGQLSALLPMAPGTGEAYVRSFVRGFPGQPVFVVVSGGNAPKGLGAVGLRKVDDIVVQFPMWQESVTSRPDHAIQVPVELSVWRVT
jgi:hypothetical protein